MPVRAAELTPGRTFGLAFEHGDDLFSELIKFCDDNGVRAGYMPGFVGAFRYAKVVGTCHRTNGELPMLDSFMEVEFVEALGFGTLAFDPETNSILPHVHLSLGRRLHAAEAVTSHLFDAEVQFLTEMILVETTAPAMTRPKDPTLFGLALLSFGSD